MSYVVLARKWRPMSFEDLIGQEHVSRTLANAIENQRVAHAFLFTGVRGVGKTTSARILAKALNCMGKPGTDAATTDAGPTATPCLECDACREIAEGTDMDVREIDGASYNGVDEVRRLQDSLPYRPSRDRYKIFIIDEVHMLSQAAWNAFLKTLEEPPPHVKFIFATTEVHKVPVTILSRVQRFDFKLIPAAQIAKRLQYVLEQEGIESDAQAISILAREAAGSMRDAMSLLDQVIPWGQGGLKGQDIARVLGVASRQVLHDLVRALHTSDAERCLKIVSDLANQGFDIGHVARDLLALLRDCVVAKVCDDADELLDLPEEEARDVKELAKEADADDLLRLHRGFSSAYDDILRGGQPRASLEMVLVQLARRPPLIPIDDLIRRLGALERRLSAGGGSSSAPSSGGGHSQRPPGQGQKKVATAPAPDAIASPASATPPASTPSAPTPRASTPSQSPSTATPPATTQPAPTRSAPTPSAPTPRASTPSQSPSTATPPAASPSTSPAAVPPAVSPAAVPPAPVRAAAEAVNGQPAPSSNRTTLDLWQGLLGRIETSRPELAAMLKHAAADTVTSERIVVSLERGSVFEATLTSKDSVTALELAAAAYLGGTPKVTFRAPTNGHAVKTVAAIDRENRERAKQAAIAQAENHPSVRDAISILGAQLKDIQLAED